MSATKPRLHGPAADAEALALCRETFRLLNDPAAAREDADALGERVAALQRGGRPDPSLAPMLDAARRRLENLRRRLPASARRARRVA